MPTPQPHYETCAAQHILIGRKGAGECRRHQEERIRHKDSVAADFIGEIAADQRADDGAERLGVEKHAAQRNCHHDAPLLRAPVPPLIRRETSSALRWGSPVGGFPANATWAEEEVRPIMMLFVIIMSKIDALPSRRLDVNYFMCYKQADNGMKSYGAPLHASGNVLSDAERSVYPL
ncbi:hypothetical protein EIO60_01211|nr:hypothetical protein [Candidatus Pantoea persica]